MKSFKECRVLFIAGVEGSGTTLMLKLFDKIPGYASLGGNYFSEGYQDTGARLNELTEKLWRLPRPSAQKHREILTSINNLTVEKDINTIVYKRSYPFSGPSFIPHLEDIPLICKDHRIILMRRHFFENVNSILRRNFEDSIDNALSRISLGYQNLYKQIHSLTKSSEEFLTIDYQRLVDANSKQSEITQIIGFLDLPPRYLDTWSQMIGKPNKIQNLTQRSQF
jgi:hypothetical protein